MRQAAVAGHGIIMEPSFIVYQAVENGLLSPILPEYSWPRFNAYAVYPPTRYLSNRVRAFVEFLAERFAGVPYWDQFLLSG